MFRCIVILPDFNAVRIIVIINKIRFRLTNNRLVVRMFHNPVETRLLFIKRNLVVLNWLFIPYNEIVYNMYTVLEAAVEFLRQFTSWRGQCGSISWFFGDMSLRSRLWCRTTNFLHWGFELVTVGAWKVKITLFHIHLVPKLWSYVVIRTESVCLRLCPKEDLSPIFPRLLNTCWNSGEGGIFYPLLIRLFFTLGA